MSPVKQEVVFKVKSGNVKVNYEPTHDFAKVEVIHNRTFITPIQMSNIIEFENLFEFKQFVKDLSASVPLIEKALEAKEKESEVKNGKNWLDRLVQKL